ncbi:muscarinic acetylcholine receptor M3-like [Anneissia japonica]|uniref:muscarinic acetylcholine receptor M3-like n=1 Tax=Anneissia japonica TaxID=1529436 RepID=UPI0014257A9A|nr:muscarinic acetylcholine receptor M3-like [Anneissia japonica]XP_033106534.1 muscarinic acetylcholine receptor M3-like [Anneissia japonica]XP_033106535.1 muscarinic acetylcholine receptor M3-like [Anneissia japonica]XP_033106536.1 muscarinic acetylcholine receptor M3-like [Anneissia japonica]XP_033106539.1 muscarinic acetylcholine receptor M3-like [Anneissia japonica]XP_033106540.1 muscarinic acetylcholine receptor M3-like [Anneissia japonica]XP_033106541.1 muscarinic acetylcholine recepto
MDQTTSMYLPEISKQYDGNVSNMSQITADMPLSVTIPVATLMICVSIVTSIGNALVIHAIRTEKRLQTVSNYFIMSLAVADMLIGLIVTPLSMLLFVSDQKWILGLPICQAWLSVDYVCSTASIFNLFVLSLDRYWSITSPLRYIRKRTVKRAAVMISFVWIFSSLWIIPILFWHMVFLGGKRSIEAHECETEFHNNLVFKIITAAFNFYIPLVVMVYIYIRIYWEIRRRSELAVGRKTYGFKKKIGDEDARMVTQQLDLTSAQGGSFGDECDYEYESMSTSKEGTINNEVAKKINYVNRQNDNEREQFEELLSMKTIDIKSRDIDIEDDEDLKEDGFHMDSNSNFEMDLSDLTSKLSAEAQEDNSETQESKIIQNGLCTQTKLPIRRCSSDLEYIPSQSYANSTYAIPDIPIAESNSSENLHSKVPPKKRRVRRTVSSQQFETSTYTVLQTVNENEEAICIERTNSVMIQCMKSKSSSFPRQKHTQHNRPIVSQNGDAAPVQTFSRSASLSRRLGITLQTGIAGETLGKIKRFSLSKEKKALKQLGAIVGCFVICWLPYFVVFMIVSFCEKCVNEHFYYSTIWLGYINSALNPFIYPLCNNNFRVAFRRMLRLDGKKEPDN